uniref:putative F-box/FBD/LRR-repeat protein At1g78760 isoform X3 n=1 Tax=Ziziphus jujuba TaxID=326968 RepID=A0A6P4A1G5_ZIZJJ
MATKRVKVDCGGTVDESHTMMEDRISQLPDPLIHHIFSFLPSIYLVRMSLLSHRWRHMWVSAPFIYFKNFCNITFDKKVSSRDRVLKFVTNYVKHRELCMHIPNTSIIGFKCDTPYWFASRNGAFRQIDDWLNFVVRSKVKELDLHLKEYLLPPFVFNASSLTVLKLTKLNLFVPSLSSYPSLKVLSLDCVKSNARSLQNLISGCPIIEELYLSGSDIGRLHFAVSETLRSLSLLSVDLTNQWLDSLFSRLPLLERFFFKFGRLKYVSIRSHSLKHVSIEYFYAIEAALTTPNLVSLHIVCEPWSKISVETPNLLEVVNLTLKDDGMIKDSYISLVHLLSNLNFLKKMVLTIYKDEVLIFPKHIRQKYLSPMPNLKHLKVMKFSGRSFTKIAEMRESLLWCAPSLESVEIGRDGTWIYCVCSWVF